MLADYMGKNVTLLMPRPTRTSMENNLCKLLMPLTLHLIIIKPSDSLNSINLHKNIISANN